MTEQPQASGEDLKTHITTKNKEKLNSIILQKAVVNTTTQHQQTLQQRRKITNGVDKEKQISQEENFNNGGKSRIALKKPKNRRTKKIISQVCTKFPTRNIPTILYGNTQNSTPTAALEAHSTFFNSLIFQTTIVRLFQLQIVSNSFYERHIKVIFSSKQTL